MFAGFAQTNLYCEGGESIEDTDIEETEEGQTGDLNEKIDDNIDNDFDESTIRVSRVGGRTYAPRSLDGDGGPKISYNTQRNISGAAFILSAIAALGGTVVFLASGTVYIIVKKKSSKIKRKIAELKSRLKESYDDSYSINIKIQELDNNLSNLSTYKTISVLGAIGGGVVGVIGFISGAISGVCFADKCCKIKHEKSLIGFIKGLFGYGKKPDDKKQGDSTDGTGEDELEEVEYEDDDEEKDDEEEDEESDDDSGSDFFSDEIEVDDSKWDPNRVIDPKKTKVSCYRKGAHCRKGNGRRLGPNCMQINYVGNDEMNFSGNKIKMFVFESSKEIEDGKAVQFTNKIQGMESEHTKPVFVRKCKEFAKEVGIGKFKLVEVGKVKEMCELEFESKVVNNLGTDDIENEIWVKSEKGNVLRKCKVSMQNNQKGCGEEHKSLMRNDVGKFCSSIDESPPLIPCGFDLKEKRKKLDNYISRFADGINLKVEFINDKDE